MIKVRIIADSINAYFASRMTTFEIEYPRIVHSELMTHRMLSKNSASSRAIPIASMIQSIKDSPAMPEEWGKNKAGMQADELLSEELQNKAKEIWLNACKNAIEYSEQLAAIGAHKQVANRLTEPFQHMKVVISGTDFNNFFWLRNHKDADPTIRNLAAKMQGCYNASQPVPLRDNQWHLPYVETITNGNTGKQWYFDENKNEISLNEALMISASCCAQVSFRKSDGSLEKAEVIFDRLINSVPCHASPVEHQAMVLKHGFNKDNIFEAWPMGITHVNRENIWYSGNLRQWIQYRQLIPNNAKKY